jgi:hypothetical protein
MLSALSITQIALSLVGFFSFALKTLSIVIIALLPMCISRAKNIPSHIQTLFYLFKNVDPESQNKKLLASVLLLTSAILPFMALNLMPLTGLPLIPKSCKHRWRG